MSILRFPLIVFLTNFLHVSPDLAACAVMFIAGVSLVGFLALTITDEETQKGLLAPVVSSIGFLCGLIAAFVLPPVIWQLCVLVISLLITIGVTVRWFYSNNFKKVVTPSTDGEATSEEPYQQSQVGNEPVRHQKRQATVDVNKELLHITEERSDVPLEVFSH